MMPKLVACLEASKIYMQLASLDRRAHATMPEHLKLSPAVVNEHHICQH